MMADLVDLQSVRARHGVYFDKSGNIRNQSLLASMCLALADAHQGTVSTIDVVADGDEITVTDDDPGLSVTAKPGRAPVAQEVMSILGACGEHKPHPQYADVLCAISLAAVNAISTSASIVTMIDGEAYAQRYSLGVPTGPFKVVARDSPGTRVRFTLDKRWAGRRPFDLGQVEAQVGTLGLNLEGTTIRYFAA